MALQSLSEIVEKLRKSGQLIEIKRSVNTELEVSEIADRMANAEDNAKALLFSENGTRFPLLMNMFATEKITSELLNFEGDAGFFSRMQKILSLAERPPRLNMDSLKVLGSLRKMKPLVQGRKGKCQQVIIRNPDLNKLPVIKCWPFDGGRFITLPLVHTMHPDSRQQNTGMYRMQIFDEASTGMHWHRHKGGAAHFEAWKKYGGKMPVTVTLGGDPVLTYAATAPLPEGISEYMLAGFMKNSRVKLVKSITNDIMIPDCSDVVIEGYIDTAEALRTEGPFGDHTGYYSLPDAYPVFHVTCITHRRNAVYPATLVGVPPKEDRFLGDATTKVFMPLIQKTLVPELLDMYLPAEGGFHNLALVKIKKSFPAQAVKTMHALWGAGQMMFTKIIVVCSEETDIRQPRQVLAALAGQFSPVHDLHLSAGPYDVLDHAAQSFSHGGKAGFDLTKKLQEEKRPETASFNPSAYGIHKSIGNFIHIIFSDYGVAQSSNLFLQLTENNTQKASGIFVIADENLREMPENLLLWHVLSTIDPARDFSLIRSQPAEGVLVINACSSGKKAVPGGQWPAVTVMSEDIRKHVDEHWDEYGCGDFIPSPSLQQLPLQGRSYLK